MATICVLNKEIEVIAFLFVLRHSHSGLYFASPLRPPAFDKLFTNVILISWRNRRSHGVTVWKGIAFLLSSVACQFTCLTRSARKKNACWIIPRDLCSYIKLLLIMFRFKTTITMIKTNKEKRKCSVQRALIHDGTIDVSRSKIMKNGNGI